MVTSEYMKALEGSRPRTKRSADFESFWAAQLQMAVAAAEGETVLEPAEIKSAVAKNYNLHFHGTDGALLNARYITPKAGERAPLVLAFHDYNRSVRGWHHLTRYRAIGYSVAALECRAPILDITAGLWQGGQSAAFVQYYRDALTLARLALTLPNTDTGKIIVCGDGMGAALALAVAALMPENACKCAVCNPMPCDMRRVWEAGMDTGFYGGLRAYFRAEDPRHSDEELFFERLSYIDCANFAHMLRCRLLLGTALMDKTAPAATQYALLSEAVCEKQHLIFPKHEHELNNFYENEQLKFLLS